jgi:hypothetical protein
VTTYEPHYVETRLRIWGRKLRNVAAVAGLALAHESSKTAPVVKSHVIDHGYSIIGFALVDAAMFTHSLFTGLLVTGLSFLLFEWKVASE